LAPYDKDDLLRSNVTHSLENIEHPLDKIFGGIPAGYWTSPTLQ